MTNRRRRSTHPVTGAAIAVGLLAVLPPLVDAQPLAPPAMQLPIRGASSCLYEDYVGFVWRCTDRGIVRFDGREEVTFATGTSDLRAILRGSGSGQYLGGCCVRPVCHAIAWHGGRYHSPGTLRHRPAGRGGE